MAILQQIVEILVGGISGVAKGVGQGLNDLITAIMLNEGASALGVFGTIIIVFGGVALALGLCRWVLNFVTSLGQRNR